MVTGVTYDVIIITVRTGFVIVIMLMLHNKDLQTTEDGIIRVCMMWYRRSVPI